MEQVDRTEDTLRGDERLSEADLVALRLRIAGQESAKADESIRIADVSEATGIAPEKIAAALESLRSERAISSYYAEREPFPFIHAAAFGVLGLALGVVLVRLYPSAPLLPHPRLVQQMPASPPIQISQRKVPVVQEPGVSAYSTGPGEAPPGFQIMVVTQKAFCDGMNGHPDKVNPLSYEEERDWLVRSTRALIGLADASRNTREIAGPMRDWSGSTFMVGPNEAHFTLQGWSGTVSGKVAVPLTATGTATLQQAATDVLADVKKIQDDALNTNVDPNEGLVTPPPGYTVEFAGRRTDIQTGPRLSFLFPDVAVVQERLLLAIQNAAIRDRKPPIGHWTGSAEADAKIPTPASSRVTITDRDGNSKSFDIPTGGGWNGGVAATVRNQVNAFRGSASGSLGKVMIHR